MSTLIACGSCGSNVVPRLWTYGGGIFKYSTTQHICPICGVVMYETGGQIKEKLKFLRWLLAILVLGHFLPNNWQSNFVKFGLIFLFSYYLLLRPVIVFSKGFMDGYKGKK